MYRQVPLESFDHTALPVLAADSDGRVRFCNYAAAELFGCDVHEAIGRRCWRLARLRIPGGVPFCSRDCPIVREARKHQLRAVHEVRLGRGSHDGAPFDLLTFLIPPMRHGRFAVLHLLTPPPSAARSRAASDPWAILGPQTAGEEPLRAEPTHRLHLLSSREWEVLRCLADGRDVASVAGHLRISPTTVRNHVQGILHKLHVHRQVEAILALVDKHH